MAKLRRITREKIGTDLLPEGKKQSVTAALEISNTECGQEFTFELRGNHLRPFPEEVLINGIETPWYEALTDKEKLTVLSEAASEYRLRSRSDFKVASIGITENGEIFVSENMESGSSPFYRQCGEQNMTNAATQRGGFEEFQQKLAQHGFDMHMEESKRPTFIFTLVMGGAKDGDRTCPCGNCTVLLPQVSSEGSPLYIAPVRQPLDLQEPQDIQLPTIDRTSNHFSQVPPGQIWKTTAATLNANRYSELKQPKVSRDAYRELCEQIASRLNAELNLSGFSLADDSYWKEELSGPPTTDPEQPLPEAALNSYAVQKLRNIAYNRIFDIVSPQSRSESFTAADVRGLMEKHIFSLRYVIGQNRLGKYYGMPETLTSIDKSLPCAEIGLVMLSKEDSRNNSIRRVRVYELSPRNIKDNKMETSPKDGLERFDKAWLESSKGAEFGYVPFNNGALQANGIRHVMRKFPIEALWVSQFSGRPNGAAGMINHSCSSPAVGK